MCPEPVHVQCWYLSVTVIHLLPQHVLPPADGQESLNWDHQIVKLVGQVGQVGAKVGDVPVE